MACAAASISICEKGGSGLILPLGGDAEQEWPRGLRIVLYLVGLLWCFAGVAIIADVFMAGIEKVTSKKLRLFDKEKNRFYTFELWNATVANLTLMALGSSAPEILLNVIDIFAKEYYLEGLGPGTIVGSAAFNLEVIIAVCICSIPAGQVRYIKEMKVYMITAATSIFAYVWLLIILMAITPNVVDVWEGVLTFLFFPILTVAAWMADKGYFGSSGGGGGGLAIDSDMSVEQLHELEREIRKKHGEHLTNEQVTRILQAMSAKPTSRAAYRIGATRAMFGGKRIKMIAKSPTSAFGLLSSKTKIAPEPENTASVFFAFHVIKYAVLESAGKVSLQVLRSGDVDCAAKVHVATEEGEAKENSDYKPLAMFLEYAKGETSKTVEIDIVDDKGFEEDERFYVTLSKAECEDGKAVCMEGFEKATITIIDDDDAGMLSFEANEKHVNSTTMESKVDVLVRRKGGGCGQISVDYKFENEKAVKDRDYSAADGTLTFLPGQMEGYISFTLLPVARIEMVDDFRLIIENPQGGATLDDTMDGGAEKNILTIFINPEAGAKDRLDKMKSQLAAKWGKSQIGHANWASQFKEALLVNGGGHDDDDDDEPRGSPSIGDWITHIMTVPWKLLFAFVPPTDFCGGWACFSCALIMIGIVTAIIGDMASLLGCVLCLPDEITSITFVALGTSLPDLFASMSAAAQDPHADASVGNVTGSNCVNVFLGLGLPWMIAAIKWAASGKTDDWNCRFQFADDLDALGEKGKRDVGFVVFAGSLGFSVAVFSCCAVVTILILAARRRLFGGELGGPTAAKWASGAMLIVLWIVYIAASSAQTISERGGLSCAR